MGISMYEGRRRLAAAVMAVAAWLGAQAPALARQDAATTALAETCEFKRQVAYQEIIDACDGLLASSYPLGDGGRAQAMTFRGLARAEAGLFQDALADATAAMALNPGQAAQFYVRGRAYHGLERYAEAIADFDRVVAAMPEAAGEPLMYRAFAKISLDRADEALRDLDAAVAAEPGLALAWFNRGRLRAVADPAGAVEDFTRVIELLPEADGVYGERSSAHLKLKDYDRAIADADRAAELAPAFAGHHNDRCWSRAMANRDLAEARAACDESLRLRPDAAHVLDSRGLVGLRQGRFQDAWNDYDAAVRGAPDAASYRYGRGLAALRLGRTQEGQADIVAALGLDATVAQNYADMGIRP